MDEEWRVPPSNSRSRRLPLAGGNDLDSGDPYTGAGGRYARAALGDLSVAQARWWNSYFDMLLKLVLLGLYIFMGVFSIAYLVPLTFDAIVNAIYLFAFPFAFALVAAILLGLSIIDAFNVGLSYEGLDAYDRPIIVSYRDRTINMLLSGMALLTNVAVGVVWAIWFGRNTELDTKAEFETFSTAVVQYYAFAATCAGAYLIIPLFGIVAIYANVRYEMAVHLVDNVMRRTNGKSLEMIFRRTETV